MRFEGDGPEKSGFDLREAGTAKSLVVYVAEDRLDVPGIARLGTKELDVGRETIVLMLAAHDRQIKGLLRDQLALAGTGNALSDEILHAARLSPFAIASKLGPDEMARLFETMRTVLESAVAGSSGRPAADLKDSNRRSMRINGRTGKRPSVRGRVPGGVLRGFRSPRVRSPHRPGGRGARRRWTVPWSARG